MKARVVVLLALMVACKSTPVATTSAPASIECKSPRFDAAAPCDAIETAFYADMADACGEAEPDLAEALRAVSHDATLRTPPVGSEHWTAQDRKSFTLYRASWRLLPPECTTDFNAKNFPVDDYGRGVREVSHLWETEPRCRPFDLHGTVDVGVWSFTTVLAPHLDATGKAYVRKLLVCEER